MKKTYLYGLFIAILSITNIAMSMDKETTYLSQMSEEELEAKITETNNQINNVNNEILMYKERLYNLQKTQFNPEHRKAWITMHPNMTFEDAEQNIRNNIENLNRKKLYLNGYIGDIQESLQRFDKGSRKDYKRINPRYRQPE